MTAKGLFWLLIGPAAWTLILLIVSSGKAETFVEAHALAAPSATLQPSIERPVVEPSRGRIQQVALLGEATPRR